MKNEALVSRIIIITLTAGAIFFVPSISIKSGVENTKDFIKLRDEVKPLNELVDKHTDSIIKNRTAIATSRGEGAVDIEDPKAIYEAITSIPGITNFSASRIAISPKGIEDLGEYKPEENVTKMDGLQIEVVVEDYNVFLKEVSKLNIPYETLNTVPQENKLVFRFNTKGGLY